jgi:hypothetical protein
MPTRSNSLRAMMENSASPRGEARADRSRRTQDRARDRRGHQDRAAFGQRQPGEILPGADGLAGIGQDLRDLQARPVRPYKSLLAGNQDAERLDQIGKAEFRRFEHRHRRALRRILRRRIVRGEGGGSER